MITVVNDFRSNVQTVLVAKSMSESPPTVNSASAARENSGFAAQNSAKSHSGYWVFVYERLSEATLTSPGRCL